MLTPVELAALVTATKGSIEIFDKIAGQIRSVLERRPKEEVGAEDRWRYKVGSDKNNIVVTQDKEVIQTLTGDELASKLKPSDLRLVKTFEEKMESDFRIWSTVYKSKDASQDPEVNAKTGAASSANIENEKGACWYYRFSSAHRRSSGRSLHA